MFPAICESISAAGDWQSVLTSVSAIPDEQRRSFSWIWPTESCLEDLRECFRAHGIHNVLSIGCGSGLLEWILQESCALKVSGIELDKSWWTSAYAPATFIPLSFTGSSLDEDFLQHCAPGEPFILLFCYFNNGGAFWDYLRRFQGDFVMIAGPRDGADAIKKQPDAEKEVP
ncbi:uncharacterized protein LOC129795130 [Lutzomyia longipalpis]|uniref:uncharacterized protein LOC129795130 n=1 Tax=Lutzomyia longipalpis TaxID=7200 RepID=UPI0024843F3D|nr:uncharacterized protein LOC129795130 [Lutzomyia longipalpis]